MELGQGVRDKHQEAVRLSRVKLAAMLVLLVVLVWVAVHLSRWGGQEPEEPLDAETQAAMAREKAAVNPKALSPLSPGEEILAPEPPQTHDAPAPKLTKEEAERLAFMSDPKTLEEAKDGNAELEPRPFYYMVHRVWGDTSAKLRAEADPKLDWAALWEQPAAHRGKAIRISGQIMQMREFNVWDNPMGLKTLTAYRIRAENAPFASKGHLYDVYAIEKLKGALRYDHVTAYGRFLKTRLSEPERPGDPEFQIAIAVVRGFEPLAYLSEPRLPEPVVDGNRAEARPLYWLLKRARSTPMAELKAQANDKLTYLDFTNRPERYRGRPVAVRGQLRRLIRVPLPAENPIGMPDVFYGQFSDQDRKTNTFYCIDVPEGVHLGDPVVVYGYFLKKWTYTSEGGYEVHSPIFVAKQMLVIDYSSLAPGRTLEAVLIVAVGATALALGVAFVLTRRADRRAAEARRQRETELARSRLGKHHEERKS